MQVDLKPNKPSLGRKLKKWLEVALETCIPITVILLLGFITYAFAYRVLWNKVHKSHPAASIGLICGFGVLLFYVLAQLAFIHIYGPGHIRDGYIQSSDDDPFLCDPQGYALYCSECKAVKPNRAHHSVKLNRCVPVMDHFCVWLGAVIGQENRKAFSLFTISLSAFTIYVLVVLLVYQHSSFPQTLATTITTYILIGLFGSFVVAVAFQQTKMLLACQTTLNSLKFQGKRNQFVNFSTSDGSRVVVNLNDKNLTIPDMFAKSRYRNLCDVMGQPWEWLLPTRPKYTEPMFNEEHIASFRKDVEKT